MKTHAVKMPVKTYAVKNEVTGFIDEAWTLPGLIEELAGIIDEEDPTELSAEDVYARHFDMATLEALRDFQALSAKLTEAGLTQMIEDIRVEKNIPAPPDEEETISLRLLLSRIKKGAEWVPFPSSDHHIVNDMLVIGRVERFDDKGATYGTTLMGERTGAMPTDEAARELVLLEAAEGRMSTAKNRRRSTDALEKAGKIGERLLANLVLHGPGSVFDSIKALGISFVSASPQQGTGAPALWLIRGATNVPAELPAWLTRKERAE